MFNTIYLIKDDMIRMVTLSDYGDNGNYYRINNGKRHYEDVTKYISNCLEKGWKKVSHKEYIRTKYKIKEGN